MHQCGTTRIQLAEGADAAGAAAGAGAGAAGVAAVEVELDSPVEDSVLGVLAAPVEPDVLLDEEPRLSFL